MKMFAEKKIEITRIFRYNAMRYISIWHHFYRHFCSIIHIHNIVKTLYSEQQDKINWKKKDKQLQGKHPVHLM